VANLARFDSGGVVDAGWKPTPNGTVHSLLVEGVDLYVGGEFTAFGKAPVFYPAKYLVRVPVMIPDAAWQPQPDDAVFALATDGVSLFAGGRFTKMARAKRKFLAQLPLGGAGTATSWNPNPNGAVYAVHHTGSHLYVGGVHTTIANYVWRKLTRFQATGLALDTTYQSSGDNFGIVSVIEPQADGSLFVGGSFEGWDNDISKRTLVRIVETGASLPPPVAVPPPADDPAMELLEAYFAPSLRPQQSAAIPLPEATGIGLTWEENENLPPGMVARVQWSHDLRQWQESGDSADGLTRRILIEADGQRRTARILTDGSAANGGPPPLFLRVAVTPGETQTPAQP
jgi:hypothetical protein